ncbi:hypothetical protein [Caproiciproducens faecalis]|uniref:Uncharacterized protein n=1 Tax=Caproiciproducens faecalis TaxID=2820301 RepID=A0ABS7DLP1_9FIRM|nr:hypothetical protein [Caproiciproducens faecalis]MBW7572202.1 hypothetical protein [Caproiciproducens faecalis]
MFYGDHTNHNLNLELQVKEPGMFRSGGEKKAEKAAKEAVRNYHKEIGIYKPTFWERVRGFFIKKPQ